MQPHYLAQVSPWLDETDERAAEGCLQRRWLTEGPQAAEFVARLKTITGARHVVLAPNGTLALFMALTAMNLPRGGEVVMPAFTFMATASAAVFAGLKPVLVDVDPFDFAARPEAFEAAITSRTVALLPVHIYGQSVRAREIAELGQRRGIPVLEDAAQACGVSQQGRHAGTWGTAGIISFFADKSVTMGEGGAILTDDDALARSLHLLRNQGRMNSGTFIHESLGMNFRVTDLQCAVGNAQLARLEQVRADRLARYARYEAALSQIPGLRFMKRDPSSQFIPFRFPLLSSDSQAISSRLERAGIQTRRMFYPLNKQPCLQGLIESTSMPVSEHLYEQGLCLPIHQDVTEHHIATLADAIAHG